MNKIYFLRMSFKMEWVYLDEKHNFFLKKKIENTRDILQITENESYSFERKMY